jgi:cytosine/adenosine deaminase-related metal-dependent hydrolase
MKITVHDALVGADYTPSGPVEITLQDGRIAALDAAPPPAGPRRLAIPALADAHNHARPLSTTSFGCGCKPLETWLPSLAMMPAVDAYTAAAASFARSLRGGATSVMVHLTRPMGLMPLPEEAREIARAAQDVGVAIGFAIALRDRNPLVYGAHDALLAAADPETRAMITDTWLRPLPGVDTQLAWVDAVADAVADLPGHVDVQYGPTGVQWCSDAMLRAVADASAHSGRRVHMHLLETGPQRDWADQEYPDGIVAHLDRTGLLSPRLTLAHCVWARPDELATVAARGARIAVNPSSNLHLFSGMAPVPEMLEAGVDVAMGLDGCALDEDEDGLRELRLFYLLNHAPGFARGGLSRAGAMKAACATGRAALGLSAGGTIAPGMPADLLILDLDALDRDALMPVDARDFVFARAARGMIVDAYAGGRRVLSGGQVTGVDLPALEESLRAAYRTGLSDRAGLIAAWPMIEAGIAGHYKGCH